MKNIDLNIRIRQCGMEELSHDDRLLVESAMKATAKSYSPYSHFCVGAALLLADGNVVTGANQENAAFPSGLCAERTAIFAAQAQHPDQPVRAIAVAARSESGYTAKPIAPCGACLQVMLEVEHRYGSAIRVLLYGTDGTYIIDSVKDMLPINFDAIPD